MYPPLGLRETFGLTPFPERAREALRAFRGAPGVAPSRFDLSSLGILMPALSVRTWLGHRRADRRVPIYNLVNRTPTPVSEGWSIRKTQVRDFRGGDRSYDSHNGTDLILPIGTVVVAAAPGKVLRISRELDRAGLKIFLDHGRGLITTSNHLGRALVEVGQIVARGEPIALSGYSGIDAIAAFPWSAPHVHFNVWLDSESTDPFAAEGEIALWQGGNDPRPRAASLAEEPFTPTDWDEAGLAAAIAACTHAPLAAELAAIPQVDARAMALIFHRNYYPLRFAARPRVIRGEVPRAPTLSLPLRGEDFDGIALD